MPHFLAYISLYLRLSSAATSAGAAAALKKEKTANFFFPLLKVNSYEEVADLMNFFFLPLAIIIRTIQL